MFCIKSTASTMSIAAAEITPNTTDQRNYISRPYNTRRSHAEEEAAATLIEIINYDEANEVANVGSPTRNNVTDAALASATAIATSLMITENRVMEKTRDQYKQTMDFMARQCLTLCPDAIQEGTEDAPVIQLPMSLNNIKIFFGIMGAEREDATIKSKSTVTGYISALKHAYRSKSIPIPDDQTAFFKNFSDGYKRVVADKKQKGIMKQHEGKVACSYLLYTRLAKLALFAAEQRSNFSAFVHIFLVLCWNLFCRSISVCEIRTHHFSWENDMMVIDLSKVSNNVFFMFAHY